MLDLYADFGITPGNATRASMQAAFDAVEGDADTPGELYITPHADPYPDLENLVPPNHSKFFGDGKHSKLATQSNCFFIEPRGKINVHFYGIELMGDSAIIGGNESQSLLAFRGCMNYSADMMKFSGGARGINVGDDNGALSVGGRLGRLFMDNIADSPLFIIRGQDVEVEYFEALNSGNGGTPDFCSVITVDDASGTQTPVPSRDITIKSGRIIGVRGNSDSRLFSISGSERIKIFNVYAKDIGTAGPAGMVGVRLWKGAQTGSIGCKDIEIAHCQFINIADDAFISAFSEGVYEHDNLYVNWGCRKDPASPSQSAIQLSSETINSSFRNSRMVAGAGSKYGIYHSSASCTGNIVDGHEIDRNGIAGFVPQLIGASAAPLILRNANGQFVR